VGLASVRGESRSSQVDDLVGTWKLKYTTPDGEARGCLLAVARDGTVIRADYTADNVTRPARSVAFDQGELSFWVDGLYARRPYTLNYRMRRRGDALRGSIQWKYGWASGSFDLVGERVSQSLESQASAASKSRNAAASIPRSRAD
jgi:hypothetical protein